MEITVDRKDRNFSYSEMDDKGILRIINTINKGIDYKTFKDIAKNYPFSLQNWSELLHISNKTISRYQKEGKSFDPIQSEKIVMLDILHSRGVEVFGDSNDFITWLQTENLALGKIKPESIMNTGFGIALLMDELTRIEHGILA